MNEETATIEQTENRKAGRSRKNSGSRSWRGTSIAWLLGRWVIDRGTGVAVRQSRRGSRGSGRTRARIIIPLDGTRLENTIYEPVSGLIWTIRRARDSVNICLERVGKRVGDSFAAIPIEIRDEREPRPSEASRRSTPRISVFLSHDAHPRSTQRYLRVLVIRLRSF